MVLIITVYRFHHQRKSIKNEKLLGVLNFNLMIPIEEEQLQLVDTATFKRDRENIKYYKRLCVQELEWCRRNSEVII